MKYEYIENFGINVPVKETQYFIDSFEASRLLEGAEVYDTLCPINPLTGHRDNPLNILRYALSPKNERLLDSILQDLPSVQEMDVPDDVKLEQLVSRLETGTFAERDIVMKRLGAISDVLFQKKNEDPSNELIDFSETPNPESVGNDA